MVFPVGNLYLFMDGFLRGTLGYVHQFLDYFFSFSFLFLFYFFMGKCICQTWVRSVIRNYCFCSILLDRCYSENVRSLKHTDRQLWELWNVWRFSCFWECYMGRKCVLLSPFILAAFGWEAWLSDHWLDLLFESCLWLKRLGSTLTQIKQIQKYTFI